MKIRVNVKEVPVSKIKMNPWNPNKQSDFMFEKERHSIRENGFLDPILVRGKGAGFEIIDGEHRYRAAVAEGYTTLPVNDLGKVSDVHAKQLTFIMNETRGKADPTLLEALLKDIEAEIGLDKMAENLPMQRAELESILAHSKVDWDAITPGLAPSVVGEAPPKAEPPSASKPMDDEEDDSENVASGPKSKTIAITVPEDLYSSFFEQINRVNEILAKAKIDASNSPVAALQAIVDHLRHEDLESKIGKDSKVILRKGNKKRS